MQELILLPEEESIGERADKYLAVQLPQYSRSFFQKLFKDDQIQIQNTPIKASYRITGEEEIALTIPDARSRILFRKTFRWIFCMKIRISLW